MIRWLQTCKSGDSGATYYSDNAFSLSAVMNNAGGNGKRHKPQMIRIGTSKQIFSCFEIHQKFRIKNKEVSAFRFPDIGVNQKNLQKEREKSGEENLLTVRREQILIISLISRLGFIYFVQQARPTTIRAFDSFYAFIGHVKAHSKAPSKLIIRASGQERREQRRSEARPRDSGRKKSGRINGSD